MLYIVKILLIALTRSAPEHEEDWKVLALKENPKVAA